MALAAPNREPGGHAYRFLLNGDGVIGSSGIYEGCVHPAVWLTTPVLGPLCCMAHNDMPPSAQGLGSVPTGVQAKLFMGNPSLKPHAVRGWS